MHDIARFIISYKTRIVWAVFRYNELTISLIDFFSAWKSLRLKNENAGKWHPLLSFFLDIFMFGLNNADFCAYLVSIM